MADTHDRSAFVQFLDAQPTQWPKPLVIKEYWPGASRPKPVH
jgi:hypothetical protein